MNYKNKIDSFLIEAKRKFLNKTYSRDLKGLKDKSSDFKDFLLYAENFKIEINEDNSEEIKNYFYSELKKVRQEFFA